MPGKIDEMRDLVPEELEARLVDLRADIAKEKALSASGTRAEKPAKVRNMRRTVARILTILKEKKMGINVKKGKGAVQASAAAGGTRDAPILAEPKWARSAQAEQRRAQTRKDGNTAAKAEKTKSKKSPKKENK